MGTLSGKTTPAFSRISYIPEDTEKRTGNWYDYMARYDMENKIKVFENRQVRTLWNAEEEEWYFSVIDVVAVLTNSTNPRKYWSVLKTRLRRLRRRLFQSRNSRKHSMKIKRWQGAAVKSQKMREQI